MMNDILTGIIAFICGILLLGMLTQCSDEIRTDMSEEPVFKSCDYFKSVFDDDARRRCCTEQNYFCTD